MTPPGETCKITYDWGGPGHPPQEGDGLVTSTGRRYLIVESRESQKVRRNLCRMRYTVLVLSPEDPDPDRVEGLVWDRRDRVVAPPE